MGARIRARLGRRMLSAAAALLALGAPAGPASAAPNLVLAPSSGEPGAIVQATVYGIVSGDLTIWWDKDQLLLGSDPSGRVRRVTFAVPSSAAPGQHVVRACNGSKCPPQPSYADATFTVPGPTAAPTPKSTPKPTPKATPKPTPTPTTPRPSSNPTTATDLPAPSGEGPSSAPIPTAAATQTTLPGAGGGLVVPTMQPVGDPAAPGTVAVVLPWLIGGLGLVLGALLLRKVMLDYAGTALLRIPRGPQTANKKQPRTTLSGLVPGDPNPTPTPAPPTKWSVNSFDSGASGASSEGSDGTITSPADTSATEKLTLTHEGFLDDAPGEGPAGR